MSGEISEESCLGFWNALCVVDEKGVGLEEEVRNRSALHQTIESVDSGKEYYLLVN